MVSSPCCGGRSAWTYLLEVWDRLRGIIRPLSLQCNTRTVHTSLQVPKLLHDLLNSSLDGLIVRDVDSHVECFALGRYLFGEGITLLLRDDIKETDIGALS